MNNNSARIKTEKCLAFGVDAAKGGQKHKGRGGGRKNWYEVGKGGVKRRKNRCIAENRNRVSTKIEEFFQRKSQR